MAIVSSSGIQKTTLEQYITLLETRYREKLGSDVALAPETPLGQLIGVQALALTEQDESLISLSNALSVSTATGAQLDTITDYFYIQRIEATRTRVEATLTGVPGTTVPINSRASTGNESFRLTEAVLLDQTGSAVGIFEAVELGAIDVAVGALNRVETSVSGWETVNNAAAGQTGRDRESDDELRLRYRISTARQSAGTLHALQAALFDVGVNNLRIEVNDTDTLTTVQTFDIDPHSIVVIAQGGLDSEIATAISANKSFGTGLSAPDNSRTVVVDDVKFQRASEVAVSLTAQISTNSFFAADGIAIIKVRVEAYFEALQEIGEDIDVESLRVPIYSVLGLHLDSISMTLKNGNALPAATALDVLYTLSIDDITITVSE